MKNITGELDEIYHAQKAIVINVCDADRSKIYVEAYDFDDLGKPVNAHPLSGNEMQKLAESLLVTEESHRDYLESRSLLPENLLYKENKHPGTAIWYTTPKKVNLLFKPSLGIKSGKGYVPALIWKADVENLSIYALKTKLRPGSKTQLFKAPFFNIYEDGNVCMGTVEIDMEGATSITSFMKRWEDYFWNSYFSHLLGNDSPVSGNIVQLWQQQVNTNKRFPVDSLTPIKYTLNDLLK